MSSRLHHDSVLRYHQELSLNAEGADTCMRAIPQSPMHPETLTSSATVRSMEEGAIFKKQVA